MQCTKDNIMTPRVMCTTQAYMKYKVKTHSNAKITPIFTTGNPVLHKKHK